MPENRNLTEIRFAAALACRNREKVENEYPARSPEGALGVLRSRSCASASTRKRGTSVRPSNQIKDLGMERPN